MIERWAVCRDCGASRFGWRPFVQIWQWLHSFVCDGGDEGGDS